MEEEPPVGPPDWKLLRPIEREVPPPKGVAKRVGFVVLAVLFVGGLFWVFAETMYLRDARERAAAHDSTSKLQGSSAEEARRAIQQEIALLLRPSELGRNIGGDPTSRRIRLGLAYAKMALLEEREGNLTKRDSYFQLAKRHLRQGGGRELGEEEIRRLVAAQGRR